MLFTTYCQMWRISLLNGPTRYGMHFSAILSNHKGITAYICRRFIQTTTFLVTFWNNSVNNKPILILCSKWNPEEISLKKCNRTTRRTRSPHGSYILPKSGQSWKHAVVLLSNNLNFRQKCYHRTVKRDHRLRRHCLLFASDHSHHLPSCAGIQLYLNKSLMQLVHTLGWYLILYTLLYHTPDTLDLGQECC